MSVIGKNIKKIRMVKKLSQAAFAEIFNLARPSVGAYEEERSEPKLETVIQIAKYFGISIDSLLTKELTINDLYHFNVHVEEGLKGKPTPADLQSPPENIKTVMVPASKQLEYIVQINNRDFLAGLPKIFIPGFHEKDIRAFEKRSDDMHIHSEGVFPGDLVLAKKMSAKPGYLAGKMYVIVTSDSVAIRRVQPSGDFLHLIADNPNYLPEEIERKSVVESWEVFGFFTQKTDAPTLVAERIMQLEHQFAELNNRLQKIEKNN